MFSFFSDITTFGCKHSSYINVQFGQAIKRVHAKLFSRNTIQYNITNPNCWWSSVNV